MIGTIVILVLAVFMGAVHTVIAREIKSNHIPTHQKWIYNVSKNGLLGLLGLLALSLLVSSALDVLSFFLLSGV